MIGRDRIGHYLQEWRGEIYWVEVGTVHLSGQRKKVESAGTVVQGYVGGLLRLGGEPGSCFASKSVGERLCVKEHLGVGS